MKSWKEFVSEGVQPTDADTAGKDQHPENNPGVPFDGEAINKVAGIEKERERDEREYQKNIFDLMMKKFGQSSKDNDSQDPTKGPSGETSGGTIDDIVKKYLASKMEKQAQNYGKSNDVRAEVPVKTTSTMFRPEKRPREDAKDAKRDKHRDVADGGS